MGIKRNRNRKEISISQAGYVTRVLQRFGLQECKALKTPMAPGANFLVDSPSVDVPYREAIGCVNFISQVSRPDVTFAVNTLARFSSAPRQCHWEAVRRLLRYLKGTINKKITYAGRSGNKEPVVWCDSDWGGEEAQNRSTSAHVVMLNHGPIAWMSRLQKVSAMSAAEAEYMSLAEALTECLWLRPFLGSLGQDVRQATVIKVDNAAAIALSKNPEFHRRTKHIGIKYHRVRQEQRLGTVGIEYTPSEDNAADALTKSVDAVSLARGLQQLNMSED